MDDEIFTEEAIMNRIEQLLKDEKTLDTIWKNQQWTKEDIINFIRLQSKENNERS